MTPKLARAVEDGERRVHATASRHRISGAPMFLVQAQYWVEMVWSLMVLKFRLRFWTTRSVGVHASDATDPLIVRYLLELLQESALSGPPC
jgi:hypothetical protein